MGFHHRFSYYQCTKGSGLAAMLAGASTLALFNSLQTETDGWIVNWAQGSSGVIYAVDDANGGANALAIQELTQQDTDILDYTSPSIKYVVGPDGNLRYAAHNQILYSQDLSDSYWTKTLSTCTLDAEPGPDQIDTVHVISDDGGGGTGGVNVRRNSHSVGTAGRYKLSVWVKAKGLSWILLQAAAFDSATTCYFNISNGTLGTFTAGANPTAEDKGDGWYKCSIEFETETDLVGNLLLSLADADGDQIVDRDGTSDIYFGAMQCKAFPADETYLKTTGSARYAIPQTHDPLVYDTSSTAVTIGLGEKTFTTAGSATFTAGQDIKCWVDDENWMSGTVTSHTTTNLVVDVNHVKGSGSHSSWSISRIVGRLCEPAATNLIAESNDFENGWTSSSEAVVTSDDATAPDGTSTASKLAIDSAGGSGSASVTSANITVSTSTEYTFSIWAKPGTKNWIAFRTNSFTTPGNVETFVDLANCVVGTTGAGHSAKVEMFSNGWCRAELTFTTDAADAAGNMRIYLAEGDNDRTVTRDGTSDIYIWGAQFETGSRPTSYIHTVGSTVTRLADDVDKDLSELPWNAAGANSEIAAFNVRDIDTGWLYSISNGTSSTQRIYTQFSGGNAAPVGVNATTQWNITGLGMVTPDTDHILAVAFKTDSVNGSLDGSIGTEDTNASIPTVDKIQFGARRDGASSMHGVLKYHKHLCRRVADADLQLETAA